ncbi:MAG: protein-L-isoaspartate(D-aspartate) O-methyltransferase [Zhengella sp.]|uniref:protein-L-isoaspartate(D-aspartate) O-methyltransferase n=1 Tax=Zhengella sp. TaxID=2282762 RepID=UPI001D221034|nr:protein-L-isoaspartate(D-aspartate) O-methyltransferase [Notoacmeibacter sp.]MCC0027109.1 protein-L-isoaspartate(D-aspartate) O-methyltransferase [Brucellaceae bacterium]
MPAAPASGNEALAAFVLRMRAQGIDDKGLFAAIEATPRRAFVPAEYQLAAYGARSCPIACGETIEGLDLQARVLAGLGLQASHRVLEIGTGSGYTAAVMARLAGRVTTVDRFRTLIDQAGERFRTLGLTNILQRHGDAERAIEGEGPFDRIVVWAAFDSLPRAYADLLSSGGVMFAAIGGPEDVQSLARLTKIGSRFERDDVGQVRFQALARGVAAAL